jgi:hypothetical protein
MQTHADANILSAGPFVSRMRALCCYGRRDGLAGPGEREEERVPLAVDLSAPVLAEGVPDDSAVVRDQLRISLAEALEKARRPLNVAKQESDGSSGQICQSLRPQQRIPARSAEEGNRILRALTHTYNRMATANEQTARRAQAPVRMTMRWLFERGPPNAGLSLSS